MNVTPKPLIDLLYNLRQYFLKNTFIPDSATDRGPLRAELFTQEQLDQYAKKVAEGHKLSSKPAREQLIRRLNENEEIITKVVSLLQEAIHKKRVISPAGEWLLDNFYLLEDQIRTGKRHLPKGYSKGLPRLAEGLYSGFPRVYDIVIEIISHSDGYVDFETLHRFISSYQQVNYLTIGELWAIPIMLRLALLENLRRVAASIAIDRIDNDLASHWADRIVKTAEETPHDVILVLGDMARSKPPMVSAFIAEFVRRIQWKGMDLSLVLTWLEQHLSIQGSSTQSMILKENQKQAGDQLSVSNSINSLRWLAKMDWREFVEDISIVENTLTKDPAAVYSKMDFFTRDSYRHAVEKISKDCDLPEHEVARAALALTQQENETADHLANDLRKTHVGYFLIDKGVNQTLRLLKIRMSLVNQVTDFLRQHAGKLYSVAILLLTSVISYLLWSFGRQVFANPYISVLLAMGIVFFVSQFSLNMVNWLTTLLIKPKPLPKLDFSEGIPVEYRSLVAVPCLLTSKQQAEELIADLEVRFLANRDPNLLFALLTDFKDAKEKELPGDQELISYVKTRVEELNEKYGLEKDKGIFLFHRPRQWNEKEKVWMGYERKRGKLADLNHLLRGHAQDKFSVLIGSQDLYSTIKYVITLDADTQLPRESGWKLVGAMAHPLNKPVYDAAKRRVVNGYTIIQPRISISLHGAERSLYARLHENDSGIDPYTRVTSDVYQDVFQEGSFIGKGIYDVDFFEQVLNQRFPENRILSHDLLEGLYARCGYATDIKLYEHNPSQYLADAMRQHRWIRGDWQIASWILPLVPAFKRGWERSKLSFLSKWKIVDNLRRSVVPIFLLVLLVGGWLWSFAPVPWTLWIMAIFFGSTLFTTVFALISRPKEISWSQQFRMAIPGASNTILQAVLSLVMLPYEAFYRAHAILQTLWRMYVSRKRLLEWNPSGFVNLGNKTLFNFFQSMWIAPLVALLIGTLVLIFQPHHMLITFPFLVVWFISPLVAREISKPVYRKQYELKQDERQYLREVARKTWAFFVDLVVEADNWLPPDNLQQYPISVIAHRTSPTNIGLALISNLTAYDFGYLSASAFISRTSKTIGTLSKLERFEGHFFNWYDTQTLRTLEPRYISTVDSGNLAGHLLTLRQGLFQLPDERIIRRQHWEGLYDTFRLVKQYADHEDKWLKDFEQKFLSVYHNVPAYSTSLYNEIVALTELLPEKLDLPVLEGDYSTYWKNALWNHLTMLEEEVVTAAPWVTQEVPEKYRDLIPKTISTYRETYERQVELSKRLTSALKENNLNESEREWLQNLSVSLDKSTANLSQLFISIDEIADKCYYYADMKYEFLYDRTKHLLSIGYSADNHQRDNSFYDLLASEARLGIFVAIAQNKIPQESWFALGRRLTESRNRSTLISWSGSMFEYLMPILVMPSYENTLLDETIIGCIQAQIDYGDANNVPWGISESCYNLVDSNLIYQYRAFGVPGLGFKRGLAQDLVISPYASVMALMVSPEEAYSNLLKLQKLGAEGKYGFFESIDYTAIRLPRNKSSILIQTFMVHHQGMSFLSLGNVLCNDLMQNRFQADREFQSALLLLQERVPKTSGFYRGAAEESENKTVAIGDQHQIRIYGTPHTPVPELQLLSNGKYHVMITNSGGGYSRWKDMAVTRWREDATCDHYGSFCYIRNVESKEFWSNTYQPTLKQPKSYTAIFSQDRAEFKRLDGGIETHTEITVSPEEDVEIRRLQITNKTDEPITIDIISYSEAVLTHQAADLAHPAFSNLFVQTEILDHFGAILCTRRARSEGEKPPFMVHLMKVNGAVSVDHYYETDRNKFIGRQRTLRNPMAMEVDFLSNSQGSVLDPIVSIQCRITIEPTRTSSLDIVTGMAQAHQDAIILIEKYQDRHFRDRVFELSFTHSQVMLRQINATQTDAQLFNRLASSILFHNAQLRSPSSVISKNQKGQPGLWSYSISGDLPIVLVQIADINNLALVKFLIQARAYWQLKGLIVDLVILNEDPSGYRQSLHDQIQSIIAAGFGVRPEERKGSIVIRSADQLPVEDKILLQTVARISLSDQKGTLLDQLNKKSSIPENVPVTVSPSSFGTVTTEEVKLPQDLVFFNGVGGFSADGKEYVILTKPGQVTPMPWINVIANPRFGSIVTESTPSYTWCENAHEYRLTPWHNDPVTGSSGEAFYIRDDENGKFWSPSPAPTSSGASYITRHGFGYSCFEHNHIGISTELKIYVDHTLCMKYSVLKITNQSDRKRKLSAYAYMEWVLGSTKSHSGMHIVTEKNNTDGAILARNAYQQDFAHHVSFLAIDEDHYSFTTDRNEFLGRNGTLQKPVALSTRQLSGRLGIGMDSCAAYQIPVTLEVGETYEIVFRSGTGTNLQDAIHMIKNTRGVAHAMETFEDVTKFWQDTLEGIQITTPDKALNILTNGWLMYQVLSCRIWGRSGFYQSGGAFGYRDQLQDVLAAMHVKPSMTREHILLSATRQFQAGDVQHWWHPPAGKGVRTMCSDDYLWLAYVTARYMETTGDVGILNMKVPYLEGRRLNVGEESYYDLPVQGEEQETLYDHCKRSIKHAFRFGDHGLCLIGSGDWNDGMNMVGIEGKGESIWLSFFLYEILQRFVKIAEDAEDEIFAEECEEQARLLKDNLHEHGWDGEWFLRAYFDNGQPLGSSVNEECSIDSICQSWSVLSGAAPLERSMSGMKWAASRLVNKDDGLIQLLDPPFNNAHPDPGYIKGYVPGVRENGGQYTHAAIWMIMAMAKLGDVNQVQELFNMINPVNHGTTESQLEVYKVEPYVMAADVYGVDPHRGRGGWTWYTGSAGWTYQLIIEWMLGIRRSGDRLWLEPCVPWDSFSIRYKFHSTSYLIRYKLSEDGTDGVWLDTVKVSGEHILLKDDKVDHTVIFQCKLPQERNMLVPKH